MSSSGRLWRHARDCPGRGMLCDPEMALPVCFFLASPTQGPEGLRAWSCRPSPRSGPCGCRDGLCPLGLGLGLPAVPIPPGDLVAVWLSGNSCFLCSPLLTFLACLRVCPAGPGLHTGSWMKPHPILRHTFPKTRTQSVSGERLILDLGERCPQRPKKGLPTRPRLPDPSSPSAQP